MIYQNITRKNLFLRNTLCCCSSIKCLCGGASSLLGKRTLLIFSCLRSGITSGCVSETIFIIFFLSGVTVLLQDDLTKTIFLNIAGSCWYNFKMIICLNNFTVLSSFFVVLQREDMLCCCSQIRFFCGAATSRWSTEVINVLLIILLCSW